MERLLNSMEKFTEHIPLNLGNTNCQNSIIPRVEPAPLVPHPAVPDTLPYKTPDKMQLTTLQNSALAASEKTVVSGP